MSYKRPLSFSLLAFQPTDGFMQQLRGIIQLEFFLDARAIGLNGLETDMQVVGNLPGVHAAAEQLKNFQFAVAQLVD